MVIFLAVYPIVVAAGLFLIDAALPPEIVILLTSSVIFSSVLSLAMLITIILAAYRVRENVVVMSAWLFLFCGVALLSLGSLIDPFVSSADSWMEELFEMSAFFPLFLFAIYIVSPLRILLLSRRQRTLYPLLALVLILAVAAVVFLPWLLTYQGPRLHASMKELLRLIKPILDTILAAPLALFVLVIGVSSGSRPYLLLGLGLLLFLPEDIFGQFHLLNRQELLKQLSDLLSIASRLYILNGALLSIISKPAAP